MKTLRYITGLVVLSFSLVSCSDSVLDTSPSNQYVEVNFWQTEEHALAGINATYVPLRNGNVYGGTRGHFRLDNLTLDSFSQTGEDYASMAQGNHDAGNVSFFRNRWAAYYEGIGRANTVLERIEDINMNENLKSRIIAEARFLRALYYGELVNYFGGVPLILELPDFANHGSLPRNSRGEVISQILADLDAAAAVLPPEYSGSNIGRATRGAALSLKARILIRESRWAEAADAAESVINSGVYELYPDYRELFLLAGQNSEEVIFDVQFKHPEYTHRFGTSLDLHIHNGPTPHLISDYLMIDGLPTDESEMFDPDNPYENRDPRLLQSIVVPGYMYRGAIAQESKYFGTGYGNKKYAQYRDDVAEPDNDDTEVNFIILRYADVLLMYAEAQNEASGPDDSVYDAINAVRDRAGMPDIEEGLTQDEIRELIRHERRIEFYGEGIRYDDQRRWRTLEEVDGAIIYNRQGEQVDTRSFNPDRDYLWPIHTDLIQDNPALEQNPGY